jgi:hypothetical protein
VFTGESHRPGLANLLFLILWRGRFPFVEDVGRDEATPSLPGLTPCAAALEIVCPGTFVTLLTVSRVILHCKVLLVL